MVNKPLQYALIFLSVLVLGGILLSFKSVDIKVGEPMKDRIGGYPTWQEEIKGFDPNRLDGVNFAVLVLELIAGIIGWRAIRNPPKNSKLVTHIFTVSDDSDRDPTGVPSYGLNCLFLFYNAITFITLTVSFIFNVGKIWVGVGVLHNAAEILILVSLGNGGRITSNSFYGWMLFYVLFVVSFCNFANWPNDALFFKFQGLCMDFALVIEFVRVYITTKGHIRDAGRDTLPLTEDDVDEDDDTALTCDKFIRPSIINHPNQIIILIVAALLHVGGNILATFQSTQLKPMLVFLFTYGISYPLYVYYVYLDTYAASVLPQKRIYVPSTPTWKIIVIAVVSISLSLLTMRLSVLFR